MKRIELFMPVMRPESALQVIQNLDNQTKLIDKLIVIDNGGDFKLKHNFSFEVEIKRPKQNIGTNASWNYMFDSKADLIGMIADDYVLESRLIEILVKSVDLFPEAGAVTATIFKDKEIQAHDHNDITGGKVIGKGHFGVALFRRCILECLPKIPKQLFIFYGDNWFGYWLLQLGYPVFEVSAAVSHYYKIDLKNQLNYKSVSKKESRIWEAWKAGKIEL